MRKPAQTVWPKGIRAAVAITFDVDAETMWLARNPENANRPVLLSMGRYESQIAIPRILDILARNRVPGSFFVPGWVAERYPQIVRDLHHRGHEVGHHGYLHEWPIRIQGREEEVEIFKKGTAVLQEVLGRRPVGYRAPIWEFTPHTVEILVEQGFTYSSNMMDEELPYRHRIGGRETDLVELPVHWLLDDAAHFNYSFGPPPSCRMTDPDLVLSTWKREFNGYYQEGKCFVLTMHPQVIGRPSRAQILEELIRYIRKQPGVWFARLDQIADYWRAREETGCGIPAGGRAGTAPTQGTPTGRRKRR